MNGGLGAGVTIKVRKERESGMAGMSQDETLEELR